jgi:hypothetical protein
LASYFYQTIGDALSDACSSLSGQKQTDGDDLSLLLGFIVTQK